MHRSIAAAAAVVALTAALTACNGSDGDGDKAGTTKKGTHSSGAVEPGGEKSPEAAPSGASSTGAKLGDTLSLTGIVGLGETTAPTADVTLNKFVDNAKAQGPTSTPRRKPPGRSGVHDREHRHGHLQRPPYTPPTVVDTAGTAHNGKPGDPTVGESLSITMTLSPGERATGWVIFDVPKSAKIASVTWQMDRTGLDTERIGTWTL
ncbi:hypothetical protein SAZ11_09375 [Streptomyces sp. FXJ1.4098]|nr:hypothetical protein [Streptomyces sp. FXJ1.4098]